MNTRRRLRHCRCIASDCIQRSRRRAGTSLYGMFYLQPEVCTWSWKLHSEKAAFIDSLLGEGLIKFDAVLIASLVDTLYINRCRFTNCIIGRLAPAASLANITVVLV